MQQGWYCHIHLTGKITEVQGKYYLLRIVPGDKQ